MAICVMPEIIAVVFHLQLVEQRLNLHSLILITLVSLWIVTV